MIDRRCFPRDLDDVTIFKRNDVEVTGFGFVDTWIDDGEYDTRCDLTEFSDEEFELFISALRVARVSGLQLVKGDAL